jgi:chromosome segregation ATPase
MSRSPYDPHPSSPRTFRERLARKFKRTVEPLAIHLLDWCRSLNTRIDAAEARIEQGEQTLLAVEHQIRETSGLLNFLDGQIRSSLNQVCALDGQYRVLAESYPHVEAAVSEGRLRLDDLDGSCRDLFRRTDKAEWGREAIVQRMNEDDAKVSSLVHHVESLGQQVSDMHWAREALVERFVQLDAAQNSLQETLRQEFEQVETRIAAVAEVAAVPQAFGLDALAMGRRIAALEDQVEALLVLLARENAAVSAALVPFPNSAPAEKAAG